MSNTKLFTKKYSKSNLKDTYNSHIYYSYAIGVDNISHDKFNKNLINEIDIINNKIKSKTYKFSPYKLKLLNKGKGKIPREIYIPTIRDRIVLKNTQLFLSEVFKDQIYQDIPQNIIHKLKNELKSKKYNTYIKIDIQNFYPSINKDILLKKIRQKVRNDFFSKLITNSLSPSKKDYINGVPQGLSISNILAHIYLTSLDKKISNLTNLAYFRFVDDILILLNSKDSLLIKDLINKEFKKLKLTIHPIENKDSKSKIGKINNGFDYLGYIFDGKNFSIRKSSINNLRNSIVECFTSYKYAAPHKKNMEFLLWRLNLKITGCIDDTKAKGWVFFFSEITDEKVLHELDFFVQKIAKQFGLVEKDRKRIKKFTRAYFEITHKFYTSNYIPNFDKFDLNNKKQILETVFKIDTKGRSDEEIDDIFKYKTRKHINKLLIDLRNFS